MATRIWPALVGLLFVAACSRPTPPNILFIVIDTLRADRLGWYGGGSELTPFLDTLAQRGTIFWDAYAQSSWTCPSMASMWTARYPSQHGVTTWTSVLSQAELTLAEVLRAHGYVTAGFVANRIIGSRLGYSQGFDTYELFPPEQPDTPTKAPTGGFAQAMVKERAERLNQASLAWLDARHSKASPIFLYLHYMEPHMPYRPPQDMLDRTMRRRGNLEQERRLYARMLFVDQALWDRPDAEALHVIEDLYDAEVMSIDAQLGKLFSALESRGFLSKAVVVVTADHGEELLDHGLRGHGPTLYNEVTHVPLLIVLPAQVSSTSIRDVVSLVDLAPTLLEMAGIAPPPSFEGRSLRPMLAANRWLVGWFGRLGPFADQQRSAYSQLLERPPSLGSPRPNRHNAAIVVGSKKLLTGDQGIETYDLAADPSERNPHGLTASDQDTLLRTLQEMRQLTQRGTHRERLEHLDEGTKEHLRALGYRD